MVCLCPLLGAVICGSSAHPASASEGLGVWFFGESGMDGMERHGTACSSQVKSVQRQALCDLVGRLLWSLVDGFLGSIKVAA